MANEISYTVALSARKTGATIGHSKTGRADLAGDDLVQGTQLISTTAELITLGEITGAPPFLLIENLDPTNFVEIGGDSGLTVFKLKLLAGRTILISPSSGTIYAKADTAAARILIVATEA